MKKSYIDLLTELKAELRIKDAELARMLDCDRSLVTRWLTGERRIGIKYAHKLAELLAEAAIVSEADAHEIIANSYANFA